MATTSAPQQDVVSSMDIHMIAALRRTVKDCSDRGLTFASKWASELLLSVPPAKRRAASEITVTTTTMPASTTLQTSTPARSRSPHASLSLAPKPFPAPVDASLYPGHTEAEEEQGLESELEAEDEDLLTTAHAYVDSKEFERAVFLLRGCRSAKARFLSVYSQFMASERKALRNWHKLDNTRHQPPTPVNTSLLELLNGLQNETDPWLLFLKGLFLSRVSRRDEAIESVLLSIEAYPWNWSAWTLLGSCIGDGDELGAILRLMPLPPTHPLVQLFQIKTLNELHCPEDSEIGLCDRLLGEDFFPSSVWIMSLRACALYHLHDFPQAEVQFNKILQLDPYRIDDIDVFSNILYVTENKTRLSKLAHEVLALDKDRPEVYCLVGNHYSLRADHEKAVRYFRRATQLDQTYLAAWTLMGHEYVEMKNSHAAIEAYRRAVDVNRKDYRAWYGLGQAYELLNMHQYALHYYHRATALRPYDIRLWQAQGMCYEEMKRPREAIECYKRALIGSDMRETTINVRIANLYSDLEEWEESMKYHLRVVEIGRAERRPVSAYATSAVFVGRYHFQLGGGDMKLARELFHLVGMSHAEDAGVAVVFSRLMDEKEGLLQSETEKEENEGGAEGTGGTASGELPEESMEQTQTESVK